MLVRSLVLVAVSASCVTSPASAQKAPKPKKEARICKPWGSTGSRIQREICKTAAEWEAEAATNAEELRQAREAKAAQGDLTRIRP